VVKRRGLDGSATSRDWTAGAATPGRAGTGTAARAVFAGTIIDLEADLLDIANKLWPGFPASRGPDGGARDQGGTRYAFQDHFNVVEPPSVDEILAEQFDQADVDTGRMLTVFLLLECTAFHGTAHAARAYAYTDAAWRSTQCASVIGGIHNVCGRYLDMLSALEAGVDLDGCEQPEEQALAIRRNEDELKSVRGEFHALALGAADSICPEHVRARHLRTVERGAFIRVSAGLFRDPYVLSVLNAIDIAVHLAARCYCAANNTDCVPRRAVEALLALGLPEVELPHNEGVVEAAPLLWSSVESLERLGFWKKCDERDGYVIHPIVEGESGGVAAPPIPWDESRKRFPELFQVERVAMVRKVWPEIVSPAVAERTRVASVEEDRIRVEVASAAVRHDLATFRRAEILKALQERLPKLRIQEVSYHIEPSCDTTTSTDQGSEDNGTEAVLGDEKPASGGNGNGEAHVPERPAQGPEAAGAAHPSARTMTQPEVIRRIYKAHPNWGSPKKWKQRFKRFAEDPDKVQKGREWLVLLGAARLEGGAYYRNAIDEFIEKVDDSQRVFIEDYGGSKAEALKDWYGRN
jgi:hypothetical protein